MKRQMILCLVVGMLSVTSALAQPGAKKTTSTATIDDIRKVDFLNFTYQSAFCSQEYRRLGIGRVIRVSKGQFRNKNAYFSVTGDRIIYADMNGDGREDAIVPIDCGATGANYSNSDVNIYTLQNGRAMLLAEINDKVMERDYRRSFTDAESYWGINDQGLRATNGNLEIDVLADGSHAGPKYVVTLVYKLTGKALGLVGKPQRKNLNL